MAPNQDQEGDASIGYEAAISLWTNESQLIWARYNAMLVANSILMAVTAVALTSAESNSVLAIVSSIAGVPLSCAWALSNLRGFEYHSLWIEKAKQLQAHLKLPVEPVPNSGLPGLTVECVSYLPILVFAVMYVGALVLALIDT